MCVSRIASRDHHLVCEENAVLLRVHNLYEIILMWSAYSQMVLVVMVGDAPSHCRWVCGYDFKAKSTFMSLQLTNQLLMKPTPHSHTLQP